MLNVKLISEDDLFSVCGLMTPREFKNSILFESSESIKNFFLARRTGKTTNIVIRSLYNILLEKNVMIWVSDYQSQNHCASLIREYSKIIDESFLEETKFCRFRAKNIKNNPNLYIVHLHNNFPQTGDFYSLKWDVEFDDSNPFE